MTKSPSLKAILQDLAESVRHYAGYRPCESRGSAALLLAASLISSADSVDTTESRNDAIADWDRKCSGLLVALASWLGDREVTATGNAPAGGAAIRRGALQLISQSPAAGQALDQWATDLQREAECLLQKAISVGTIRRQLQIEQSRLRDVIREVELTKGDLDAITQNQERARDELNQLTELRQFVSAANADIDIVHRQLAKQTEMHQKLTEDLRDATEKLQVQQKENGLLRKRHSELGASGDKVTEQINQLSRDAIENDNRLAAAIKEFYEAMRARYEVDS